MLDTEEGASELPHEAALSADRLTFFQLLEHLPPLIVVPPTVFMLRVLRVMLVILQAIVPVPIAVFAVPSRREVRSQSNNAAQHECRKRVFKELIHGIPLQVLSSKQMILASTTVTGRRRPPLDLDQ